MLGKKFIPTIELDVCKKYNNKSSIIESTRNFNSIADVDYSTKVEKLPNDSCRSNFAESNKKQEKINVMVNEFWNLKYIRMKLMDFAKILSIQNQYNVIRLVLKTLNRMPSSFLFYKLMHISCSKLRWGRDVHCPMLCFPSASCCPDEQTHF